MASENNVANEWLEKIKGVCAPIYDPVTKAMEKPLEHILDWVGDKNALIGASIVSLLIFIFSFSLFSKFFSLIFSVVASAIVFIGVKLIFYKPKEYLIDIDGENTRLSYVKDVHVTGESEIVIHSQPGYGKQINTFIILQFLDTFSIMDCRNITSVKNKNREVTINYFHPVNGTYEVKVSSNEGNVSYQVIESTGDHCKVVFSKPLHKTVRLDIRSA